MIKTCANNNCENTFDIITNKAYCSDECYKSHRKQLIIKKNCGWCNSEFTTSYNYKHRKYCSRGCSIKAKNPEKVSYCNICGKELSVPSTTYKHKYCSKKCRKVGIKRIMMNENYFDVIDSHDKSYWLGFLFADGYNSNKDIVIQLKDSDIEVLNQFKIDIESNTELKNKTIFNKQINKNTYSVRLCISSQHMCKMLNDIGMVKCKSKILKFPNISKEFIPSFIRGVFDGDGCIYIKNRSSKKGLDASFSIYSESPEFLLGIQSALKLFGIEIGIRAKAIGTGDLKKVKKIYDLMYTNCGSRRLERKYEKYKMFMDSRID